MGGETINSVKIRTTARLHLGFIDLHGGLGRIYGSLGVALSQPATVLEIQRTKKGLVVSGENQQRVSSIATQLIDHFDYREGLQITVWESIPQHVGLGSGTQLALALGLGVTMLKGIEITIPQLAQILHRGVVSGIGTATFTHGGFVIDGGRTSNRVAMNHSVEIPPLLFRHDVPGDWLFVVALPRVKKGLSGEQERIAFDSLPTGPKQQAEKTSRLILMKLLPALIEDDIKRFGEALTRIQILVGDAFSAAQGGRFASSEVANCVSAMLDAGAVGAGQSSWGPACYGLVRGQKNAELLQKAVSAAMEAGRGGSAFFSSANNQGARVITN
ncbi:MAG: beta-ribofuranosylaminobenzene 5'-phosphate synthase family protein [Candidatus Hodarchaeota archaeon]